MPQILALEYNDREARIVVASSRGESVVIEQAFCTELRSSSSEEDPEVDVGQRIATALSAHGVGRIDTLVAVGRSSIELRQLSLPPAPEEELPEMVRFQAMREFNELDDQWLLDFVLIGDPTEAGLNVLAAAIGPEQVEQVENTCRTAGLKPRRLVLRPFAAASLLSRVPGGAPDRPRLLVDLLNDEVDLTVMIGPRVIFLRTARMGGDPLRDDGQRQALLGEIRRTIAATQSQLGGQRVESVVLCGTNEEHAALAETIKRNLGISTELFGPFDGRNLSRRLQKALPDHPGRFAPLLGMALAELEGTGHAVDFLHPRHRAEPPRKNAKYVLAGTAAALLVVAFLVYSWMQRSELTADIQRLNKETETLKADIAEAEATKAIIDSIQEWSACDVCWLDQLDRLSEHFLPAKQVMLTGLQLSSDPSGGRMDIDGVVDEPATIGKLENQLRKVSFLPEEAGSGEESSKKYYSWWFKSSLSVAQDQEKP